MLLLQVNYFFSIYSPLKNYWKTETIFVLLPKYPNTIDS